nr:hypothetical protein CFP56_41679 [Quercus suber]
MQNFHDALDHCGFADLGFSGPKFTWHGRRRGEWIWERLDRGVANYEWLTQFPTGRVKHLNCFTSDHRPILLSLDGNSEFQKWHRKPFQFVAMWISNPKCKEVVERAWDCAPNGTSMFVAATKLKRCKNQLKSWSRDYFGNVKQQIKHAKDHLWQVEEVSVRIGEHKDVVRWLPYLSHSNIISPKARSLIHRVCDLFLPNIRIWDPGRLASCFLPWEANMVWQIQVCEEGVEDTLIWPLTNDGEYSVTSASRMLISAEALLMPSSSSQDNNGVVWKKIWKIQTPNKIWHFICRVAKDSLPTKQNLRARHLPIS